MSEAMSSKMISVYIVEIIEDGSPKLFVPLWKVATDPKKLEHNLRDGYSNKLEELENDDRVVITYSEFRSNYAIIEYNVRLDNRIMKCLIRWSISTGTFID